MSRTVTARRCPDPDHGAMGEGNAAPDESYCWFCVKRLEPVYACACGRPLGAADRYCPKCGKAV